MSPQLAGRYDGPLGHPPEATPADIQAYAEAKQLRTARLAYHQTQIRACLARSLRIFVADGKVTRIRDAAGFLPDACDYDDTDEADVALARLAANSTTDRAAIGEAYMALFNKVLAHAAGDMVAVEDRGGSVRYEVQV